MNNDVLYNNLQINRHVGGYQQPQLESVSQYISEQQSILKDDNKKLPPNVRYYQQTTEDQQYNREIPSYTEYLNQGCCSQPYISPNRQQYQNKQYKDVYMRNDKKRYDPYSGFLYQKGLMSDGDQRRLIRSFFIDINSSFRDINPNVVVDTPILLQNNPITFTNDSNTLFINHPNNNFSVGDHIVVSGVVAKNSILRTFRGTNLPTFEIPASCNFMKIYYNHNIPLTYIGSNITISLSGIKGDRGTTTSSSFLGSIPINILNTTHTVKLSLSDSDILCTTASIEAITGDPNYFLPSPDYFFVVLPVIMQPVTGSSPYTLRDYNFQLRFLSLNGIPLNQINANYPISPAQLYGYQTITSVSSTGYTINVPTIAAINTATLNSGGSNIYVGLIININTGYPNPNYYKIDLGNVYHDVIAVRLVSSEIPNTEKAIKDNNIGNANNKLYWNDIDDGDYLYSIAIPPGNYSPTDLISALDTAFANTPRINASDPTLAASLGITYTSKHFIQTQINQNTDVVTFNSYKEFIVNNPIVEIIPDIPDNPVIATDPNITYQITIYQPGHGMSVPGSVILIQNAIANKGIPATIINGQHIVTEIVDANRYRITLPKFNLLSDRTETGGGVNVFIYIPDTFRMLFNQPDTLGAVLGFRNPGSPSSITNFSTVISNTDKYAFETSTNALGQPINITNNALQMSGVNYIIMVADPIKTYTTLGKIKNAFAKIILCDSPGRILYNTYVNMFHTFDSPLNELKDLTVSFYNPDGTLFDFNGIDHSYTLEVVTVSDIPEGTGISANTGKNYNQQVN